MIYSHDWLDMSSAPKDGTDILICGGTFDVGCRSGLEFKSVSIAFWDRDHWHGDEANAHDDWKTHCPTAWMPLPPPQGDRADG